MDKNDNSIEQSLLLKSHSLEATKELLSSRYSIDAIQKPILILTATKGNKESKPVTKKRGKGKAGQFKTARNALNDYISKGKKAERKIHNRLRLNKNGNQIPPELLNDIPKYVDFQQLHSLWRSYITDLVYGDGQQLPSTNPPPRTHDINIAAKLATADFHGAKLKVISSHNPTLVGLEGIVIWESQSSFIIVNDSPIGGGLRIINKKGTRFKTTVYKDELDEEGYDYEILGSRFLYRTADRSNRKFKGRNVNDL